MSCQGPGVVLLQIGPLHDPVTLYKIAHAGVQVARWDFQDNATRTSPPGHAFVLEVPLRILRTSMCDFVPCDRIVQRVYFGLVRILFKGKTKTSHGVDGFLLIHTPYMGQ